MSTKIVAGNFLNDDLAFAFADNNTFADDYGAGFAHDGPGKMPAAFPADAAPGNPVIDFSLNLVRAAAEFWEAIAGSVEDSADQDHGFDASSLKVLGNAAHIDSREYEVRSGYPYWIEGWAFGSGAGPTGKISLYNPDTKHWWNGSAWVGSIAYLATSPDAEWVGIGAGAGVRVDVEAASVTLGPTTRLHVQLWRVDNSTADPVYFDDTFLYPGVDFIGIMGGHNIPAWVPVEWRVVTSAGVQTLLATFTKARGQFYLERDEVVFAYEHLIKFDIGGGELGDVISDDVMFFGDLVVGKTLELPQGPDDNIGLTYAEKGQARQESPGGTEWVANRGPAPPRTLSFGLSLRDSTAVQAGIAVLVDQLRGGGVECVLLPETVQLPWLALHGRIQQPITFTLSMAAGDLPEGDGQEHYSRVSLTFVEGPTFQLDD